MRARNQGQARIWGSADLVKTGAVQILEICGCMSGAILWLVRKLRPDQIGIAGFAVRQIAA